MNKVIGLGKLGCSIAEEMSSYPEYRIYKIDTETDERGSLSLDVCGGMDDYESAIDQGEVAGYLRSIKSKDEVLLIVEGGDPISGATLRILETIKDARIHVLYVCPDRQMISDTQRRDDKIAFNILQEYARSGVFEQIILIKRTTVEQLVGEVPIDQYEKSLSYFVAYVTAMINYFNHTSPVLSNKISPATMCRLVTFGSSDLDPSNRDINFLFPLSDVSDVHFFYGVPKSDLSGDASLITKIKDHVKSYKNKQVSASFSVYETTLDSLIVLCAAYSHAIQELVE